MEAHFNTACDSERKRPLDTYRHEWDFQVVNTPSSARPGEGGGAEDFQPGADAQGCRQFGMNSC